MNGLRKIFLRWAVKKTAAEYGIPFECVRESFEEERKDNPGKNMVIVFSRLNDEPSVLMIEERDAHFDRVLEQINRTGILTGSPI
jgi:hypothetical protein